jgi:hypothetical protein
LLRRVVAFDGADEYLAPELGAYTPRGGRHAETHVAVRIEPEIVAEG